MNDKVHGRSEWRNALKWVLWSWSHTVFIVVLLAIAGIVSVLGLLRWDQSFFRWSLVDADGSATHFVAEGTAEKIWNALGYISPLIDLGRSLYGK